MPSVQLPFVVFDSCFTKEIVGQMYGTFLEDYRKHANNPSVLFEHMLSMFRNRENEGRDAAIPSDEPLQALKLQLDKVSAELQEATQALEEAEGREEEEEEEEAEEVEEERGSANEPSEIGCVCLPTPNFSGKVTNCRHLLEISIQEEVIKELSTALSLTTELKDDVDQEMVMIREETERREEELVEELRKKERDMKKMGLQIHNLNAQLQKKAKSLQWKDGRLAYYKAWQARAQVIYDLQASRIEALESHEEEMWENYESRAVEAEARRTLGQELLKAAAPYFAKPTKLEERYLKNPKIQEQDRRVRHAEALRRLEIFADKRLDELSDAVAEERRQRFTQFQE